MIKYFFEYVSILMVATMFFYSCDYKDKGVTDVTPVSDIVIDTTGIPVRHEIENGELLRISPGISREGTVAKDFEYEWRITKKPGSDLKVYDVIGREEELNAIVELTPSSDFYTLWLRVTDKSTGLIKGIVWQVVVQTPIMQGLIVADSDNGIQSDLTLIQDTLFTTGWVEDPYATPLVNRKTVVKRNEFSRVHGNKIDGIVHSLFAQRLYQDGIYRNFLHGASPTDAFRINSLDYSIVARGKQLFYDNTVKLNVNRYFQSGSNVLLANSGKVSTRLAERNTTFGYNKFGIEIPGDYYVNRHIAVHPTISSNAIFYDEGLGKFLKLGSYIDVKAKPTDCGAETTPFEPRNMPGYQVLGGGVGNLAEARFVLKKGNQYGVFILTSAGAAKRMFDISDAPEIDKAVSFVFPSDQAVIYYATTTKVYSIRIPQGGNTTYTELYTSSQSITMLEMLRRSGSRAVPNSERCLLVISYDGTEGRITTLPIPTSGLDLGIVDVNRAVTFGGFKKISAVAVQE